MRRNARRVTRKSSSSPTAADLRRVFFFSGDGEREKSEKRTCSSAPFRGTSRRPSFLLLAWLVLSVTSSCSAYEYIGTVTFPTKRGAARPHSSSSSSPPPPPRPQPTSASSLSSSSSRTLLVTRSGRRLPEHVDNGETPSRPPPGNHEHLGGRPRDRQGSDAHGFCRLLSPLFSSSRPSSSPTSSRAPRGGPWPDTELFPFSAVGMLVGEPPPQLPRAPRALPAPGR